MADVHTKEQRHKNMAAIRAKNTKPEIIVRKFLWNNGYRYRLNHSKLPGKPDIVLRKYRTCIFVNGCFWHKHEGCRFFVVPKTRTEFWLNKLNRNQERDKEVKKQLAKMGWHSITIWECELKPSNKDKTLESLLSTLNKIFLLNYGAKSYNTSDEEMVIKVADNPSVEYGKITEK